jgi:MATE family multidrug resistance protein
MLLHIAFPMMVSHAADSVMLFTDRLFLSSLGPAHLAASMIGGITCFMMTTLFMGVIGYGNALVAQHFGAKQRDKCALAATQAVILSLISYPIILALSPLGSAIMSWAGHTAEQQVLEIKYFNILVFGTVFGLSRVALASFFSGIGKTQMVMIANIVSMVVNIVMNWILIFGKFGMPAMGIAGAAYGTIIGSAIGTFLLLYVYLSNYYNDMYHTRSGFKFCYKEFKTLVHYGFPSGIEFLLNLAAFNIFIQLFHSYGQQYASAITITFNWDMMAFIPMIGINVATTSLVGRYMGAKEPDLAVRSAYSGLKVTLGYAAIITAFFVFIPGVLVSCFVKDLNSVQGQDLLTISKTMLRMAAIYTLADGIALVFSAAIRGAGDTRWALKASVTIHWLMTIIAVLMIKVFHNEPLTVWAVFVGFVVTMAAAFYWRFVSGRWKNIQVIKSTPE